MKSRYPRHGDRWDDRDRGSNFYDRDRGLSPETGPYRDDERYFGQGDMYGRGIGGDAPDYRATSWRTSPSYSRGYGREGEYYGRSRQPGRGYARSERPDSWVGRSNFETGWGGHGTNRYDRNSYDPYWASDRDDDRYDPNERGWWDRTSDEVASWFGDEEAERRRDMDARRQGDFRGRGPKSYTRSDDRIREDINDGLTDDYWLDAGDIDVDVNSGEVILSGTVDSRGDKRRAEDIAEGISGVKNVENRLRVNDYQRSAWGSMTGEYNNERSRSDYSGGNIENQSRSAGSSS